MNSKTRRDQYAGGFPKGFEDYEDLDAPRRGKYPRHYFGEIICIALAALIAPTILRLLNLPIGRDMDGFSMEELFSSNSPIQFVESWENIDGDDGRHTEDQKPVTSQDTAHMVQDLADLGYIDDFKTNKVEAKLVQKELDWNLARSYLDAKKTQSSISNDLKPI